jgi:hypothetical protein
VAVNHAAAAPRNVKWYESSFASSALGVVALIILVVFLVLVFRQNPAALIEVLGAVTTLTGALAGLIWGTRRGRKQVAEKLLPEMAKAQEALAASAAAVAHAPEAPSDHPPLAVHGSHTAQQADDHPPELADGLSSGPPAWNAQVFPYLSQPAPGEAPAAAAAAVVNDAVEYLKTVNK